MEDGIHPLERLERIAIALEDIAKSLNKIAASPPSSVSGYNDVMKNIALY